MNRADRINNLIRALPQLTDGQLQLVDSIVNVFSLPKEFARHPTSDLFSAEVLADFGDVLRMHHCFSREPFSKDKFEYALERVLTANGIDAALSPRGQRGYDIRILAQTFSLKTEAARDIRPEKLHISKFMELGGGQWGNDPKDLEGLRGQFLKNLEGIQRILVLRALRKGDPEFLYQLVEIPKSLLARASEGRLVMKLESKQSPKPGYCYIEEDGATLFSLYFDGGGERKLQIKNIDKSLCISHAAWQFEQPTLNS